MKLSKSTLKNLIKEELQNLDEIIPGAVGAAQKAASLMADEDIFAAEKAEEFSEKSMSPHVKRLTDEVVKLKKELGTLYQKISDTRTQMEKEINELKAEMASGGPTS